MLTELRQATTEKFCNFVGQSTCSTLSKFGSSAINGLSSPIALATIGAIGLSIAIVIRWTWKATIVEKAVKKDIPVLPRAVEQSAKKDAPALAPAAQVAQINKPDIYPELAAHTLTVTKVYYDKKTTPILGPKQIFVEGEAPYQAFVKGEAPYLTGDLRMGDGSEIPLEEGDYLVKVELNDSNKSSQGKRYYYLPALLVRRLRPNLPFILQYKNEQRVLTVSEEVFEVLKPTLKNLERRYYHPQSGGFSNEPVPLTSSTSFDILMSKAKRYYQPPK